MLCCFRTDYCYFNNVVLQFRLNNIISISKPDRFGMLSPPITKAVFDDQEIA
jgi:hypothetical protein